MQFVLSVVRCHGKMGTSSEINVTSGVPQGSVLGPLLFLIYINSVTNINLSNGSTLVLYADDMLLFKPISSEDDYTNLQGDVDSLKDWSASHFLTFNPSKCKYMLLSKKNKPTKNPPVLTIDNIPIERTNSHKYLGIVLTSNLTWSEHIHCICSKAKKLLGLLYRQFYKNCDPTTLLCI